MDRTLVREHFQKIILESGTNVNGGVHRDMCLRGKFLPLIGEKYHNSGYLSWTDPTVAHYARDTAQFLEEAGMATLKEDYTPPNVSQLRPIRDFWGVRSRMYIEEGRLRPLRHN